jgi:ATP-dependent Clp protease protease subunit
MFNYNIPNTRHNYNTSSESSSKDECKSSYKQHIPDMTKLLDIYDKKVYRKHNHIYYRTDVTMSNITKLCNLIDDYNYEQDMVCKALTTSIVIPKPLYLHITSYGGDLLAGFMAYDYIKNSNISIYTVAEGYTVSAGSIMFMAGKKRLMTENSYLLIHQLNQTSYGRETFHDMMDNASNTIEFMSRLYSIYLNNLRYNRKKVNQEDVLTKEKLENHMLHDIYWNIQTCIRYGLVDDIYTNYNTQNEKDIKEFVNQERLTNTFTPSKRLTLRDLQPSDDFLDQIRSNMEEKTNVVNIVKHFLSKQQIDDNSTNDDESEYIEPIKKVIRRSKRKVSKKNSNKNNKRSRI